MFFIADYRASPPVVREKPKKGIWLVEIRDAKTRQSLLVEHDEPIDAYVFPDPETLPRKERGASLWASGERHAEGVLVGELDGQSWVCFVELKGSLEHKRAAKQAPAERALDQLEGSARHFHPASGSLGREHHDQFADGSDELEVRPSKRHHVVGLLVALRRSPMPPPRRAIVLGDVEVPLRTVRLSMTEPSRTRTSFRDLLKSAAVLP
jgi:hypothetical protein